MVVNPLSGGLGNIQDEVMDGKPYRQTSIWPAIPRARITTPILRTYNLANIACCLWSFVTNSNEVARHSS